ncbi:hypothetical protein [Kribbella sp. DT2]|uniref:hypothetical protein n=1 Tax=Kribbella sp. DT2 TaxID=3393427 RepID=UPI003CF86C2E
MITATVMIGFVPDEDTWSNAGDRIDERHLVRQLGGIGGRISKVVIAMGAARYPLVDPSLVREYLPKGVDVEVTGEHADVVHQVVEQLDPQVKTDCHDCIEWLPCPTHLVA